jgi:hypothetical protein
MRFYIYAGGPFFFMFHIRTKSYFYDITITLGGAKNTTFAPFLHIKTIILSRQARDKHRES